MAVRRRQHIASTGRPFFVRRGTPVRRGSPDPAETIDRRSPLQFPERSTADTCRMISINPPEVLLFGAGLPTPPKRPTEGLLFNFMNARRRHMPHD